MISLTKPFLLGLGLFLLSCQASTDKKSPQESPSTFFNNETTHYTTYRADGNRYIEGQHHLSPMAGIQLELPEAPKWLLSGQIQDNPVWVVVMNSGKVMGFERVNANFQPMNREFPDWTHLRPPQLKIAAGQLTLFLPKEQIEALPDTQYLETPQGLLWLSHPSERYAHGVLGDTLEATSFHIGDLKATIPAPDVIEGTSALWGDLNQDGKEDIVLTLSNAQTGARLVAFQNVQKLAESEPIGQGNRWRHQLAIAPLGPNGEMELVSVRTPHIGGVAEFFQLKDQQLVKVAERKGYSTHTIGSRNLDMALAVDITGDSQSELLLPTQDQQSLAAIQRTENGVKELWKHTLDGPILSNLSAVVLKEKLWLGAATEKTLYIWAP